jgi:hypothetical protein
MANFKLTSTQVALSSSPPLLPLSLSATTAPLPLLRSPGTPLRPPSARHPLSLFRNLRPWLSLSRRLLLSLPRPTLRLTAPPRSLLPLLLALALLLSPPPRPLLLRAPPLPSPPPVLVSSPSSVSSLPCKRLRPKYCEQPRPNLYDSKGSDLPIAKDQILLSDFYLSCFLTILCGEQSRACIPHTSTGGVFFLPLLLKQFHGFQLMSGAELVWREAAMQTICVHIV